LLDHQRGVVFIDGFPGPVFQCPNYCGDLVVNSRARMGLLGLGWLIGRVRWPD
jgi:hypothetical protein